MFQFKKKLPVLAVYNNLAKVVLADKDQEEVPDSFVEH